MSVRINRHSKITRIDKDEVLEAASGIENVTCGCAVLDTRVRAIVADLVIRTARINSDSNSSFRSVPKRQEYRKTKKKKKDGN